MKNKSEARNKFNAKKILNIIKTSFWMILFTFIFILSFNGIKIKSDANYVPTILGHTYLNVLSGSMDPEFTVNDLIIGKTVNKSTKINIGDVITYRDGKMLVTHRVQNIEKGNLFLTKGDANEVTDAKLVPFDSIISVHKTTIPKAGIIAAKFQDFTFLALVFFIFMYFIIKELIIEVKKIKANKKIPTT